MGKAIVVLILEDPEEDQQKWRHVIETAKQGFAEGEVSTVWAAINDTAEKVINFLEDNTEDL